MIIPSYTQNYLQEANNLILLQAFQGVKLICSVIQSLASISEVLLLLSTRYTPRESSSEMEVSSPGNLMLYSKNSFMQLFSFKKNTSEKKI